MTSDSEIQSKLRRQMDELRSRYGVKRIGLFGSYVRGEQHPESDVDLLVEFAQPVGFVRFLQLEEHLQQLLGAKVDLVTQKALKPHMRKQILDEVRYVH